MLRGAYRRASIELQVSQNFHVELEPHLPHESIPLAVTELVVVSNTSHRALC